DDAFAIGELRRDARDQHRKRVRQKIERRPAVERHGIAYRFEVHRRALSRELRGAVALRIDAEGLVVVPEETAVGHFCSVMDWLPRENARSESRGVRIRGCVRLDSNPAYRDAGGFSRRRAERVDCVDEPPMCWDNYRLAQCARSSAG